MISCGLTAARAAAVSLCLFGVLFSCPDTSFAQPAGFSANGTCRVGDCAATTPATIGSDNNLPVRFELQTAQQARYEVSGFIRVGGNEFGCGGSNLFAVRYLGNVNGSTALASNDPLTFGVSWACTLPPQFTQVNTTHPLGVTFSAHAFNATVTSSAVYNGVTFPTRGPFSPPATVQVSDFAVVPISQTFRSTTTYNATFGAGAPAGATIWMGFTVPVLDKMAAAVLPTARTSTLVGSSYKTVTAFATMVNSDTTAAENCQIGKPSGLPATFSYQRTDPNTNLPIGSPNVPATIPAGASQSFVMSITPTAESERDVDLLFICQNKWAPPRLPGINTIILTVSNTPLADLISISATPTNDGVLRLPSASSAAAFATAAVNIGAGATVTVRPTDTPLGITPPVNLPLGLSICRTNSTTGACLAAPAADVTLATTTNQVLTFAIFAQGQGQALPFDPARRRIFVVALQGGRAVGATSVAVMTQ